MNEPTDAASLRDERQVRPDLGTAPPNVGEAERARVRVLREVLEPIATSMGFELVHTEWAQSGARRRLQIFIDTVPADASTDAPPSAAPEEAGDGAGDGATPTGIGLADCARMSPIFGNALEAAEAADPEGMLAQMLSGAYVLEVSSPGLDRPLARLSHFQRYVGQRAKVRTMSPLHADSTQRNFHGRIQSATPEPSHPEDDTVGLVVLHDEDSGIDHRIPVAHIRRAHLVYEG
ncbi:MAG: ribosome maturation factor RimP [Myxococcota bacterium]